MTSLVLVLLFANGGGLELARDTQDRPALEKAVADAASPKGAADYYKLALAQSYLAEVTLELRDKGAAARAAEGGIKAAQKAVEMQGNSAEYHRVLGTLCGQVVPANTLLGFKYGRCALDEINKAIQLDPKNAMAYVSRGVGNYYLPDALGGGLDKALADFEKAAQLDPKLSDAQLWRGLVLRKRNRNAEAREAFQRALELNPKRVWTKQQLDKTPAK